MTLIGYHASHEQHPPSDLLSYLRQAEEAGFATAMCSDHFHPWNDEQGHSGFAWSWLGAALEATSLPMGTVCAPGQRYHPAIIAQATATLAEMYPGRFWLAVGSGEALNEHITGDPWPSKTRRNERLAECVEIMRALWRGDTVTYRGHVVVEDARLYTRPDPEPMIVGAALTPATARRVGLWADALITVAQPDDQLRAMVDAFRASANVDRPMLLQLPLSYARSPEGALEAAHRQWRTNIFASPVLADLRMPEDFEAAAEFVTPADVANSVLVSADPSEVADRIAALADLGFDQILLHNVHPDQRSFIDDLGEHVLPRVQQ